MEKIKNIEQPVIFAENQKFRQIWLWVIIAIPVVISFYAFIYQTILGNQFGNKPMPDSVAILFVLLFGLALPAFLYLTELRIRITNDGLYVKFFPIHQKWLLFSPIEIEKFAKTKYRPILEYGGWGIRNGMHGKAYNVSGNMGIILTLLNDKRLLIGSQRPDEFERAMKEIKNHK